MTPTKDKRVQLSSPHVCGVFYKRCSTWRPTDTKMPPTDNETVTCLHKAMSGITHRPRARTPCSLALSRRTKCRRDPKRVRTNKNLFPSSHADVDTITWTEAPLEEKEESWTYSTWRCDSEEKTTLSSSPSASTLLTYAARPRDK